MISTKPNILAHFTLASPREKQVKAIHFIEEAIRRGLKIICIEGPTGFGKSAIGTTICQWASTSEAEPIEGQAGGYYLVTQKLLQDQLENDFIVNGDASTPPPLLATSLKSAASYPCATHPGFDCELGRKKKCGCSVYSAKKSDFLASTIGITNYHFFVTERLTVAQFPPRKVVVLDEGHNLERMLIRFYDITVNQDHLEDCEIIEKIPSFKNIGEFIEWNQKVYLPRLAEKAENAVEIAAMHDLADQKLNEKAVRMGLQLQKANRAIGSIVKNPSSWVFWPSKNQEGKVEYTARSLYAHDFSDPLLSMGSIVIIMSAYLGEKKSFCRSLGLDESTVAWARFNSTFPVKNRPIVFGSIGSMSLKNIDNTLPKMVKAVAKILDTRKNEKGLIHCVSYKIGQAIVNGLKGTPHENRIIYPTKADEREEAFLRHKNSSEPTVLLSPSMMEGFDFAGDAARWQIVAKIPYPSLSDEQIRERMNRDQRWYDMETVKSIVQMTGRIVRSETDYGITYILDADIESIYSKCKEAFPPWWSEAIVRPSATATPSRNQVSQQPVEQSASTPAGPGLSERIRPVVKRP